MKQITKDTVLKQGDKSYPAIQTEQGIVWIDKDAEIKEKNKYLAKSLREDDEDELLYSLHIKTAVLIDGLKIYTKAPYKCLDGNGKEYMNYSYTDKWRSSKIIAANFELEGVPKIELEDEDIDTESIQKELGTWGHDEGLTEQEYKEWQSFKSIKEITVDENFKQI